MIIAFSGMDGSGKSTLANKLASELKIKKNKIKIFYLGEYWILSPLVNFLHTLQSKTNQTKKHTSDIDNPFLGRKKRNPLLKTWILFSIIDNWLTYMKIMLWSKADYIVICDRYFYDRLIGLELNNYSNKFLSWLYLTATPPPNKLFIIDVNEKTAQKRETGFTHEIQFYKALRKKYKKLANKLHIKTLYTNEPLEKTLTRIKTSIRK